MAKKITHLRSRWLTEIFRLTEVVICINEKSDSYFVNVKKREKKIQVAICKFSHFDLSTEINKNSFSTCFAKTKSSKIFLWFSDCLLWQNICSSENVFRPSFRSAANHFLLPGLEFASSKNYGKC